jgi:type IV pilus assembly protein PilA
MESNHKENGFTLIELMIVVSIIGILATIAIPSYQKYVIRAKLATAFVFLGSFKTDIVEYYTMYGRFPQQNDPQLKDIFPINNISSKYLKSLEYVYKDDDTALMIATINPSIFPSYEHLTNPQLVFQATGNMSNVQFKCYRYKNSIPPAYLPSICRESIQ